MEAETLSAAYTLGLCVLYSDSGFWGWVPPIRLCGHQLEGGFSPSGQKMLRAGRKPAPLCVRGPPGMLWVPLPVAPLVETCTLLPGGLPPLPRGLSEGSTGLGGGHRALSLPRPLPSSSSAGRAERLEPSLRKDCSSSADGAVVNRVTLEKSSLHHGVLHSSLLSVGDLINLLADVGAERYISPCLSIPFSVVICLNCKSS